LIDTPHIKGLSGSRYWDGDGLATKNRAIIDKGHIRTFFINTYTANKMGMQPTVESPSVPKFNLEDFPAKYRNLDAKSIIKILDKGIFVTGFNGGNCNGATGDFSYGIQGFYFENGEILFPIKEMNISGNILKLWKNIALIGNDARTCSRWMIPSLAFTDVDFTGI
jgi:PmbA protein